MPGHNDPVASRSLGLEDPFNESQATSAEAYHPIPSCFDLAPRARVDDGVVGTEVAPFAWSTGTRIWRRTRRASERGGGRLVFGWCSHGFLHMCWFTFHMSVHGVHKQIRSKASRSSCVNRVTTSGWSSHRSHRCHRVVLVCCIKDPQLYTSLHPTPTHQRLLHSLFHTNNNARAETGLRAVRAWTNDGDPCFMGGSFSPPPCTMLVMPLFSLI